jgi:hypothetical protein
LVTTSEKQGPEVHQLPPDVMISFLKFMSKNSDSMGKKYKVTASFIGIDCKIKVLASRYGKFFGSKLDKFFHCDGTWSSHLDNISAVMRRDVTTIYFS